MYRMPIEKMFKILMEQFLEPKMVHSFEQKRLKQKSKKHHFDYCGRRLVRGGTANRALQMGHRGAPFTSLPKVDKQTEQV